MGNRVVFTDDGSAILDLSPDGEYIITKWYKSSLAVFEERKFRKYISALETKYADNGHGSSVMRYFLSAAVSMMSMGEEGWKIPQVLKEYAAGGSGQLCALFCPDKLRCSMDLPLMLIASEENMDGAMNMTIEKHSE